jgi:surfactin synthase thioesterase subunit
MFPGDHFYLNSTEKVLLQAIAKDMYDSINAGESQTT